VQSIPEATMSQPQSHGKIYPLIDFFQITNYMHNYFIPQQYVCFITILNMSRAVPCSSSGGQIVLLQPLVSSRSVNSHTVCRLRADCSPLSTGVLYGCLQTVRIPEAVVIQFVLLRIRLFTDSDDTRGCSNTIYPPEDTAVYRQ